MSGHVHDRTLLDALEAIAPIEFAGEVWRVVVSGRDPTIGSRSHGRWSGPNGPEVLYTSLEADGALAEIGFRLSLEPVWPSKLRHQLFKLTVSTRKTLKFASLDALGAVGVDVTRYEAFDYAKTQEIAAAANFLEFDGIQARNARYACDNLMLFPTRAPQIEIAGEPSNIDWSSWRRRPNDRN